MTRLLRCLGAALLLACLTTCEGATARARVFAVHVLWLRGAAADREDLDRFMECLLGGSTFEAYWEGEARLSYRGSWVVDPPQSPLGIDGMATFLSPLLARGALPAARPGETPVYLLLGDAPTIREDACGRHDVQVSSGGPVGVALVRADPPCWPGTTRIRNETQIGQHEIAEVVDLLLGHAGCAGDGACEGNLACAGACDNLTGLVCPGAPTQSFTGCGPTPIDGWAVQKLGSAGRSQEACDQCFTCEFTVRAREP